MYSTTAKYTKRDAKSIPKIKYFLRVCCFLLPCFTAASFRCETLAPKREPRTCVGGAITLGAWCGGLAVSEAPARGKARKLTPNTSPAAHAVLPKSGEIPPPSGNIPTPTLFWAAYLSATRNNQGSWSISILRVSSPNPHEQDCCGYMPTPPSNTAHYQHE